jgi:hypothetical protein
MDQEPYPVCFRFGLWTSGFDNIGEADKPSKAAMVTLKSDAMHTYIEQIEMVAKLYSIGNSSIAITLQLKRRCNHLTLSRYASRAFSLDNPSQQ